MKIIGMNREKRIFIYDTNDIEDVWDWLGVSLREHYLTDAWEYFDQPEYDGCFGKKVDIRWVDGLMTAISDRYTNKELKNMPEPNYFDIGYSVGKSLTIDPLR